MSAQSMACRRTPWTLNRRLGRALAQTLGFPSVKHHDTLGRAAFGCYEAVGVEENLAECGTTPSPSTGPDAGCQRKTCKSLKTTVGLLRLVNLTVVLAKSAMIVRMAARIPSLGQN